MGIGEYFTDQIENLVVVNKEADMNNFQKYFDKEKKNLESFVEVRDELLHNKALKWEDYYWATKYLFENDQEGQSDSIIIDYLENAVAGGLNIYSNKELFLDASKILARMYFKYKAYRKAENSLMLLRDLALDNLPDWVFLYSATTNYKNDIVYAATEPQYFFTYLEQVNIENEGTRHQYISIIKDYLNNITQYILKNSKSIKNNISIGYLAQRINPVMDEVAEEWNNLLISVQNINHSQEDEKLIAPDNFYSLSPLVKAQAYRINTLEEKLNALEDQIVFLINKESAYSNDAKLPVAPGDFILPSEQMAVSNNNYMITGRKPKFLVFGAAQIPVDHMRGIAKAVGLDKDQLEFMVDYDQNKRFNFDSLRYNSPYGGILIGPNAHKMVSIDEYSSIIQKLTNEDGFPPVEEIRTNAGELKITKTSFRDALKRIITHIDSISIDMKS